MHKRISLANLPTPIQKLERLSSKLGVNLYIKRDDYTGSELSGNKVRKLEYVAAKAIAEGCDTLITCGAVQSNHCRATAVVAAKLGLSCHVVLSGREPDQHEGNLFLDSLAGATIHFVPASEDRLPGMETIAKELAVAGHKALVIPVGASDAVGARGYENAYNEIQEQEQALGLQFAAIVSATGSGGTYAGQCYANLFSAEPREVIGMAVCDCTEEFVAITDKLMSEMAAEDGRTLPADYQKQIQIIDEYVGLGYALSRDEELEFILDVARGEGVFLDPVYSGKAFYGLISEINKGRFAKGSNILFIHTGGLLGWTVAQRERVLKMLK